MTAYRNQVELIAAVRYIFGSHGNQGVVMMKALRAIRTLQRCLGYTIPFALMLGVGSLAQAEQVLEIHWQIVEIPPGFITQGPLTGQGFFDQFLDDLVKTLPQFKHDRDISSPARSEKIFKAGKLACSLSTARTSDREEYLLFSKHPILRFLPMQIIANQSVSHDLEVLANGQKGQLSLAGLLDSDKYRLGVIEKRHYGETLDREIDAARKRKPERVYTYSQYRDGLLETLFPALEQSHIDITLGFSVEMEYLRKIHPRPFPVRLFSILEDSHLHDAYISCAKSNDGQKVIDAVNAIENGRLSAAIENLKNEYESYLSPSDLSHYHEMLSTH